MENDKQQLKLDELDEVSGGRGARSVIRSTKKTKSPKFRCRALCAAWFSTEPQLTLLT